MTDLTPNNKERPKLGKVKSQDLINYIKRLKIFK